MMCGVNTILIRIWNWSHSKWISIKSNL